MRAGLTWALLLLTATIASAQPDPPLFVYESVNAAAGARDQRGAVATSARVGMRLDILFDGMNGGAARLRLNVGAESWTAVFERRDDDDRSGFRTWVGTIEGIPHSHVVFTERDAVVSGLIDAVGVTYQIRTDEAGSFVLERVDIASLGDEREPLSADVRTPDPVPRSDVAARDDAGIIDLLILYTPAARSRVGGTAQVEALAAQIASDTNTAFARSRIQPRVRLVSALELNFVEGLQMVTDLALLKASPDARLLRDVFHADLVQLIVSSPDQASCGIGYLLSVDTPDFDAYSMADVTCVAQYTPTHELAHNMGSHHAPEDGAAGGLFPYSYAYKDPDRGFRTVMAYPCAGAICDRILNFSNPTVEQNGGSTGSPQQDNARSINDAAPYVANFRTATAPATLAPAPPTGLRTSVSGNSVTVNWTPSLPQVGQPSSPATSYVLQAGSAPNASNLFNASVGNTTTASGVLPAGTYYWRVIGVNSGGLGAPSAEAQFVVGGCQPPGNPVGFAFVVDGRIVTLTWFAPSFGSPPTTYVLEAGSGPALADLLVSAVGLQPQLVTPAPPGTYYVRVRAQNACGTSGPSNEHVIVVF
jgi:hypothetical protein